MITSWIESATGRRGNFLIGNTNHRGLLILMEPDASVRDALNTLLSGEGWEVLLLLSANELARQLECQPPVAVICETSLSGMVAQDVLAVCIGQQIPLIFTSHEQAVQQAVDLVQQGAAGYLQKPFSLARLLRLLDQFPDRHNSEASRHR